MRKLLTLTIAVLSAAMAFAEGEPVITAWRNSINTNDKTDFASLYVSNLGTTITGNAGYATGKISYLWEKSTDSGTSWVTYADGKSATTNNIRPIIPAQYRCTVTLKGSDKSTLATVTSDAITVSGTSGSSVTVSSNIPVIVIRTDAKPMPDCSDPLGSISKMYTAKQKRSADCKILWNGVKADGSTAVYSGSDFDAHNGKLYYDKKIRISYRGSSSMTKAKKNYAFVVGKDACEVAADGTCAGVWQKDKEDMFSLSAGGVKDKDWILYAAADDRPDIMHKVGDTNIGYGTLMRNTLQLDLYEEMSGNWNSHCRYARLFVDGVDLGTYIFMEKNKQSTARIDVEEDGFIFKYDKTDLVDRYDGAVPATDVQGNPVEENKCTFISQYAGQLNVGTYGITIDHAFEIVYPEYGDFKTDAEWNAKVTALKGKITAFENAVKENQYSTLRTLIDYESFADYFIIEELAKNVDGYRISQYFKYNTSTAKMKAEPLWDTELGINNHISSGANSRQGLLVDYGAEGGTPRVGDVGTPYIDDFPIPFWWTGETGGGKAGMAGSEQTSISANTKYTVGSSTGLLGDACFKAKVKQRWAQHSAEGGPLTWTNIQNKLNTYVVSVGGSVNSVFPNWFSGNDGRIARLGAIINGWEVPTYVNSVSANFDGEESTVLEKHVNMEGSVTMQVSATAGNGDAPTLYYSWQRSDDGQTNWVTLVDDVTTTSQTFDNIQESGYYRARAKSSECDCIKYSSANTLHVIVDQVKVVCE